MKKDSSLVCPLRLALTYSTDVSTSLNAVTYEVWFGRYSTMDKVNFFEHVGLVKDRMND
jgi:hypothetical protein